MSIGCILTSWIMQLWNLLPVIEGIEDIIRVIYKADHRSYDRAKSHMIGQNLSARSS